MSGWVAGAVVVAGVAGAVISADAQSSAASSAADSQAQSSAAAVAEQRRQFDKTQANYQPFIDTAHRLLPQYESEISRYPTAEEVMNQPGYQFGLKQGQLALDRKAAAAGGRVSGAALKAASRYGADYATAGYGAEFARRESRLARLGQLAGLAPITAAANAGQASTNAISGLLTNQGDAAAAGALARGNIWGGATNSIAAQAQRALQGSGGSSNSPSYNQIASAGDSGFINPLTYSDNYG
jgi:hypothetical protein